jgi:hypothetical protein
MEIDWGPRDVCTTECHIGLNGLSFAHDESMSEVIRDWKRFHGRTNHVIWQQGYFDHRLRADERGEQLSSKMNYLGRILWLWVCARKRNTGRGLSTRSHASIEVDRRGTLSGTMPSHRRRRKMMFPERPAHRKVRRQSRILFYQRVEDNAFHL